jgi:putative ABC transport system ATP-binding protein
MNIIGCLDSATEGTYRFDGTDITAFDEKALAKLRNDAIGFVFQQFNLLPRLSARANVALPLVYSGHALKERNARADELLALVGLAGKEGSRPAQLSGGQQQRVAVARAPANRPRLLLADEPTGNLDDHTAEAVRELLFGLNRELGTTLVLVTHDLDFAARCDRVLRLHEGRLQEAPTERPPEPRHAVSA